MALKVPTKYGMPKRTRTHVQDSNQFAASIVAKATGSPNPIRDPSPDLSNRETVSQIMREMGRRGGIKGAATLNAKLTPEQRQRSARKAAKVRWATAKKAK